MKHKFSKVFFVVVMLLIVSLLAVACNGDQDNGDNGNNDPVKYAVTYVGGDGADGTAPNGGEYEAGATFSLPDAGTLSKTDYKFGGWSYGGQTYAVGATFTMPANAVEFSAVWVVKNQIVQYDTTYVATLVLDLEQSNGFIEIFDESNDSTKKVNFTYTLEETAIAITLENNGGTFNGTFAQNVLTINITYGSKTYEFKASEQAPTGAPTVSFDANGGTGTAPQVTVQQTGDMYKFTIPQNTYTAPANKEFKAWEILVNNVSKGNYNPGKSFIAGAGEKITLKAVWENIYISDVDALTYLGNCKVPTTTIIGGVEGGGQTYTKFVVSVSEEHQSVSYLTKGSSELVAATGVQIDTLPKAASDPVAVPCIFAKLADNLGYYLVLSNSNSILTLYDMNGEPIDNGVFNVHYDNPATYQAKSKDESAELNITWYEDEGAYSGTLTIGSTVIYVIGTVNGNEVTFEGFDFEGFDSEWKEIGKLGTGEFIKGETLDIAILYNEQYYLFGNAEVEQVTVTFDPNNGEATWTETVYKGLKITIPSAVTSNDGKTFKTWRNPANNSAYNSGNKIAVNASMTLKAEFVWTISFESGEGATGGKLDDATIVEWGSTYFIILPQPTGLKNEGKHFVGWTCDGGTTVLEAGTKYSDGNGNMTFTAVWEDADEGNTLTYVGSTSERRDFTKIVIETGDSITITITYIDGFGRSKEKTDNSASFTNGKYVTEHPMDGGSIYLVLSDDNQTLTIYEDADCSSLIGSYTLEA